MSGLNYILLCALVGVAAADIWVVEERRDNKIITAIIDNGCASKRELETSKVERIDNYNLNSLRSDG